MKNLKNKLKNILFLVIVLFTFSCSKDAYDENLNLDSRDYHFKKINFLELSHINNQAFIESAKLKKVLPADKHNTIESISDFDIDLQNIQYLKKTNSQETFSFRILQSATATFSQNIVIDCKPNQSPQTYLITYYLNKQLGQISTDDMFMNSITSTSTSRLNSSSSNVTNTSGCLEVGYYEEEDYCEGELSTPGENPECFNNDGSRRKVLVFKVLASDCSTSGGEDFIPDVQEWMNNHQNPSNPTSGNGSNGLGGGGENSSNLDIFIPNYFNSDDLSNPATQNMLQINQFIYNLYASDNAIKNVVESTEWLLAYTNYWIGVNGGLSSSNQNALTYAFNNMSSVFYQYPDTINTQAQISLFQYNAFQFLLQHGTWLSGQSSQTQESIKNYLIENGFNSLSTQEIDNIIDIWDDGKINGVSVVVGPDVAITNMSQYLSCFNTNQSATLTIYADQPITGSHSIYGNDGVGHAFISIKQGINVKTFGFYPQSSIGSVIPNGLTPWGGDFYSTPGVFGNDQGHNYDVSVSIPVSSTQLTNIINGTITIAQSNPQYNLGSFNCTDLAIIIFESNTNINIPNCESPGIWSGQTPGTLGEKLKNLTLPSGSVLDANGGTSPNNYPN